MILLRKLSVALAVLMFCLPELGFSQGQGVGQPGPKTSLSPAEIRAAYAACEKFSVFIDQTEDRGEAGKFFSDINNYSVVIEPEKGGYAVSFSPMPYKGELVAGGSALYHVNGVTYQVTGERHYK